VFIPCDPYWSHPRFTFVGRWYARTLIFTRGAQMAIDFQRQLQIALSGSP
jgi:hypothetical protein